MCIEFLNHENGQIAIYDAVNALSEGRRSLAKEFSKHEVETLFIESACDDEKIIEENVRNVKISSPDYIGWTSDAAVKHYLARMSAKIPHFETMEEPDLNYIKMINAGERITVNNCSFGYLSHRYAMYFSGSLIFYRCPSREQASPMGAYCGMASAGAAFSLDTHFRSKRRALRAIQRGECHWNGSYSVCLMLQAYPFWEQARAILAIRTGACCLIGFCMPLKLVLSCSSAFLVTPSCVKNGSLPLNTCRIVFYLLNLHIKSRHTYFARAGTSREEDSYKTDASLSEQGKEYAKKMSETLIRHREGERRK